MTTPHHDDTPGVLAAAYEHIEMDMGWRFEKAARFLVLIEDGEGVQTAHKRIEADPELFDMEREARRAGARARLAWLEAGRATDNERTDDD